MTTQTERTLDALFGSLRDIYRDEYLERDDLTSEELREARIYTRGMAAARAAIRDASENPDPFEHAA